MNLRKSHQHRRHANIARTVLKLDDSQSSTQQFLLHIEVGIGAVEGGRPQNHVGNLRRVRSETLFNLTAEK